MLKRTLLVLITTALLSAFYTPLVWADAPRVMPEGKLPDDARLGDLKDLNGYFPFTPSKTSDEWKTRAEQVRRRILVATGLWPMPQVTPNHAVIHGRVERDKYTVERVFFESYPGHFVTGSLYRPKGKSGKLPGVLCPHGHWAEGRFYDAGQKEAEKQMAEGAERYLTGAHSPLQARCAQLARMGCVVFHYDMLGNADSKQIPPTLSHGYSQQRPEFDTPENWGLFSTQAELRAQNIMGIQTYNSIRALDFLLQLPDVDAERIGVTGASGGGTQTFILCAVDPRPAVAFPAVMVSTAMQGGCTCENCCNLRVGTGNIEFAALMAPRPLGMTGANDWTVELATKGFPELKQHYTMLGVPDLVMADVMPRFGHNYNNVSREVMYEWFNKHLKLGQKSPIVEEELVPLSIEEMTVWDASHPKPPAGGEYERSLVKVMTDLSDRQITELTPGDAASLATYRAVIGGAIDVLIGRTVPAFDNLELKVIKDSPQGDYTETAAVLRNRTAKEETPLVILAPKSTAKRVVIWPHEAGKAGLYGTDGKPHPVVLELVKAGSTVVGADLLYQGEFLADGKPLTETRRVNNKREFAGYTLGYNSSLFAQRVHDLLGIVAYFGGAGNKPPVDIVGAGKAGAWAAAARAQAGKAIDRAAIDTAGFRFTQAKGIRDPELLPGVVKYGDLPGVLALSAPGELWLAGEKAPMPELIKAAYKSAGATAKLQTYQGSDAEKTAAAIKWLARP